MVSVSRRQCDIQRCRPYRNACRYSTASACVGRWMRNGRHSIEMARRGYDVVGIDVAKRYLAEARKNLSSSGQHVEFRFQRASDLRETDTFDFALAYWHTIGFMSHEEIQNHFSAVCTALKPRCLFLYVFQGPRLIPGNEGQAFRNWKERIPGTEFRGPRVPGTARVPGTVYLTFCLFFGTWFLRPQSPPKQFLQIFHKSIFP